MKKVFVAVYEHRHGADVRVFATFAGAQAWKDEIGAAYWTDVSNDPQPEGACGDEYFELACTSFSRGEYFRIDECEVEA